MGSVCRHQATGEIEAIVHSLASLGIRLHGFGVMAGGVVRTEARRSVPLAGCRHANCANCLPYAMAWRERTLARLDVVQMHLRLAA